MVDASGKLGWAPASYLVPLDDGDLAEEAKENEKLMDSITGELCTHCYERYTHLRESQE